MQNFIDLYKKAIIQIATPYSTGTGFYLQNYGVIVTNEHVIHDNSEVVIEGKGLPRCMSKVLFTDTKLDLAFIKAPTHVDLPLLEIEDEQEIQIGATIIAIGHPFGLKYTTTQGIISNTQHMMRDVRYIQHDAALNPGNSGGPLINAAGRVIGVNTFILDNGNAIGFSLPAKQLKEVLEQYKSGGELIATRCPSCINLVFENTIDHKYCPHCGTAVQLPSQVETYEAVGVPKTIENLLEKLEYHVPLSRRGPNKWEVQKGSARIDVSYYEKDGLIEGDAYLCTLPKQNIKELYQYLLQQNNIIEGLSFSIKGQDIILSLLIYDRYFNLDTGMKLFKHLFQKADDFDNILVEKFGANWKYNID